MTLSSSTSSSRRAALASRLAMFEKTIAENEKHGGGGRCFITTLASARVKNSRGGGTNWRHRQTTRLTSVAETTDPSLLLSSSGKANASDANDEIVPSLQSLRCSESSSSSSSSPDLEMTMEELAQSVSMIRFELDALADAPVTEQSRETEAELHDIMNHLEASMALNFDIHNNDENDDGNDDPSTLSNNNNRMQDSKAFDKSLSDLYDGGNMLMNGDVFQSALQYRAWKERKAKVDTGARISLKDRMKAFGGAAK